MKTILVTGATSGFGAAFSRKFIRDGHRVIATGRRQSLLADLAAEYGGAICARQLDVTDLGCVDSFLSSLPEEWRKIDVLVNNAGAALGGLEPAWKASLIDWDKIEETADSAIISDVITRQRSEEHTSELQSH